MAGSSTGRTTDFGSGGCRFESCPASELFEKGIIYLLPWVRWYGQPGAPVTVPRAGIRGWRPQCRLGVGEVERWNWRHHAGRTSGTELPLGWSEQHTTRRGHSGSGRPIRGTTGRPPLRDDVDAPKDYTRTQDQSLRRAKGPLQGLQGKLRPSNSASRPHRTAIPRGTNQLKNLQLLCGHCNQVKDNRPMKYLRKRLREQKRTQERS